MKNSWPFFHRDMSHQQISQPRTVGGENKQTWGCHDGFVDQQTLGFHGIFLATNGRGRHDF